ncbi:cytochrome c oxidase subunit II [Haloarchaeobius iranensis]|uniref:cytochrome-c oxidase n=1 Tax=Haloarchaeobius iranensis TaxID=996166 RepID=A0A1G9SYD2_9EURY|nr:cytochrome c oxidase subunit II [Haloarchaeobius iranensis]SDM40424.1 cytochrome c oxidase subunit 2 [Haloarchaeobius iranensis]
MNAKRIAPLATFGAALLLLAADPAAAQSTSAEAINGLNERLLVVAIPITVLVEGILIYTVLKFKDSDEAKPTRENRRLEITWTVATAVILLFVGIATTMVMADQSVIADGVEDRADVPDDAEHVNVTAETYAWTFEYTRHNVSSSSKLVIPEGQETYFNITTKDWLHAFHVPQLGLKQDAVPGQNNYIMTTGTDPGLYQGYCAEYCGTGHSAMMFEVEVMPQDEYETWLADQCTGEWNEEELTCEAPDDDGNSNNATVAA